MPPIKVHIDDPITPKKEQQAVNQPHDAPYPPARPGAPAVPAPSPYAPSPYAPSPYAPIHVSVVASPTRTTVAQADYGPPPPQPGAVPVPGPPAQTAAPSSLPPPPKAGDTTTLPPQMSHELQSQSSLPSRGTSAYIPSERARPTTLNFGAAAGPQQIQTGAHPPGYQQDLNAQEMSSAARASLDTPERRGSNFGINLGLGSTGGGDGSNDTAGVMWNTVKGWAATAGTTLAETEKEVWKRINKG